MPIETDEVAMQLATWDERVVFEENGTIFVVLVLMTFTIEGELRTIRDVKEQQVAFIGADVDDHQRLEAFLTGWTRAVQRVMEVGGRAHVEVLMPHDLLCPEILKLKKAKTAEDFEKAALMPSRLGRGLRLQSTD